MYGYGRFLVVLAALAVVGCDDEDESALAPVADGSGLADGSAGDGPQQSALGDPQIYGVMVTANEGEVSTSQAATPRLTAPAALVAGAVVTVEVPGAQRAPVAIEGEREGDAPRPRHLRGRAHARDRARRLGVERAVGGDRPIAEFARELLERGHRLLAERAALGPEAHHHDAAVQLLERERPAAHPVAERPGGLQGADEAGDEQHACMRAHSQV
jgi:hypothetical protein